MKPSTQRQRNLQGLRPAVGRVLLLLIAAVPVLSARSVTARAAPPYRVSAVSHGISLTLTIPRGVYPQNALIAATVRIHNASRKPAYIPFGCLFENPTIQVRNSQGQILYPPPFLLSPGLELFPAPSCPPWPPRVDRSDPNLLRTGKTITRHLYAVGRASNLDATVETLGLTSGRRLAASHPFTITTRPITLPLSSAPGPTATLRYVPEGETTSAHWSLAVHPATKTHGPLLFADEAECVTPNYEQFVEGPGWGSTYGVPRINQPCDGTLQAWRVVAGWIGQPVVDFNYIAPAINASAHPLSSKTHSLLQPPVRLSSARPQRLPAIDG